MGCSCRKYNLNESIYEIANEADENYNNNDKATKYCKQNIESNADVIKSKAYLSNSISNYIEENSNNVDNESSPEIIKEFKEELFNHICNLRVNPSNYADLINQYKLLIKQGNGDDGNLLIKTEKYLLFKTNKRDLKIPLYEGEKLFDYTSSILNKLSEDIANNEQAINIKNSNIKYSSLLELSFPVSQNEVINKLISSLSNEIKFKENISLLYVSHYKKLLSEGIKITGFHYDISPINAEVSILLQLVDDNNSLGQRRHNLLNMDSKLVGIQVIKLTEEMVCSFITFGNLIDEYGEIDEYTNCKENNICI